jgi:hypothetical protein
VSKLDDAAERWSELPLWARVSASVVLPPLAAVSVLGELHSEAVQYRGTPTPVELWGIIQKVGVPPTSPLGSQIWRLIREEEGAPTPLDADDTAALLSAVSDGGPAYTGLNEEQHAKVLHLLSELVGQAAAGSHGAGVAEETIAQAKQLKERAIALKEWALRLKKDIEDRPRGWAAGALGALLGLAGLAWVMRR